MSKKNEVINLVTNFFESDEKCMLLTGSNQFEKHYIVMALIEKHYKNAHVLFRINAMQNITTDTFTPLKKVPKCGEIVKLGNNNYEFDSINLRSSWDRTSNNFDFAIVYPIDCLCRSKQIEPIEDLFKYKDINKIFLCSWTDRADYDFSLFRTFYTKHVIFDVDNGGNKNA